MDSLSDRAIRGGLLLAVAFTALAHGAVEPWSITIFELIAIALMLLWAIKAVAHGEFIIRIPMAALPIAALIIIGLVQSIPKMDSGRRAGLSMDVEATRRALMVLVCLFVVFVISANFFKTRKQLRALARFLIIYGLMMSVFAIIQDLTWNGRFYWLRLTSGASAFGPFANRNHFAGYIGMLVPIPVALVIARGVRRDERLFYGFAAAFMGIAVVISLSRGGMISLAAGMIFLALVSLQRKSKNQLRGAEPSLVLIRMSAVAAVAFAILAGAVWLGAEDVVNRASETLSQDTSRTLVWKDTWAMIQDNPLMGTGLGTFETVYPIYSQTDGLSVVDYAHNDYLQVVAEGGVAGGLVTLWFLLLVSRALVRSMKSNDPLLAGLAVGCGGGIISILVHSIFDFNLQIPSNALLFLFLVAVVSHIGSTVDNSAVKAPARAVGESFDGLTH